MAQVVNQQLVWYPNKTPNRNNELCYDNLYLNNDPNVPNLDRGTFLRVINGADDFVNHVNGVIMNCYCIHGNACNRNIINEPALKIQPDNGPNTTPMEKLLYNNYYDQRQHGRANRSVYHVHVTEASVIDWNERVMTYMLNHTQRQNLFGPRVIDLFRRDYRLSPLFNQIAVPVLGMTPLQTPPTPTFVEGYGLVEPKIKLYPTLLGISNNGNQFNQYLPGTMSPNMMLNPMSSNRFSPTMSPNIMLNPISSNRFSPIMSPNGMFNPISPNGMFDPRLSPINPIHTTVIRSQPPPMLQRHKVQPQLPFGAGVNTTSVYAPNPYTLSPLSPIIRF